MFLPLLQGARHPAATVQHAVSGHHVKQRQRVAVGSRQRQRQRVTSSEHSANGLLLRQHHHAVPQRSRHVGASGGGGAPGRRYVKETSNSAVFSPLFTACCKNTRSPEKPDALLAPAACLEVEKPSRRQRVPGCHQSESLRCSL